MSLEFNYDLHPKQVIDLIKADDLQWSKSRNKEKEYYLIK